MFLIFSSWKAGKYVKGNRAAKMQKRIQGRLLPLGGRGNLSQRPKLALTSFSYCSILAFERDKNSAQLFTFKRREKFHFETKLNCADPEAPKVCEVTEPDRPCCLALENTWRLPWLLGGARVGGANYSFAKCTRKHTQDDRLMTTAGPGPLGQLLA